MLYFVYVSVIRSGSQSNHVGAGTDNTYSDEYSDNGSGNKRLEQAQNSECAEQNSQAKGKIPMRSE